jgi:hypothetical protein
VELLESARGRLDTAVSCPTRVPGCGCPSSMVPGRSQSNPPPVDQVVANVEDVKTPGFWFVFFLEVVFAQSAKGAST